MRIRFRGWRIAGLAFVLTYAMTGASIGAFSEHDDPGEGFGNYQACDMCGCHLGHTCEVKHGTVCEGDSCSFHSGTDCHFIDMNN